MKLTIGKQVSGGFLVLMLLAVGLAGFTYTRISDINKEAHAATDDCIPGIRDASAIETLTTANYGRLWQHIATTDKEQMARIEADMSATSAEQTKVMKDYEGTIFTQ